MSDIKEPEMTLSQAESFSRCFFGMSISDLAEKITVSGFDDLKPSKEAIHARTEGRKRLQP